MVQVGAQEGTEASDWIGEQVQNNGTGSRGARGRQLYLDWRTSKCESLLLFAANMEQPLRGNRFQANGRSDEKQALQVLVNPQG